MAQDVLEGNNVDTALAKRSKEAIGGLVPQSGSGRKSTKIVPYKTKNQTLAQEGGGFIQDLLIPVLTSIGPQCYKTSRPSL